MTQKTWHSSTPRDSEWNQHLTVKFFDDWIQLTINEQDFNIFDIDQAEEIKEFFTRLVAVWEVLEK